MNPRLKRKLLKDKRRITPPLVFGTRHCELMKIQSQLTLKYGTYIPETMIENALLCKLAGVMQPYISIQKNRQNGSMIYTASVLIAGKECDQ